MKTWSQIGKDDGDKKVDLYVAFGKDSSYYGTVGLAWVGGACNDFIKTSFNEYRNSPSETAMVFIYIKKLDSYCSPNKPESIILII